MTFFPPADMDSTKVSSGDLLNFQHSFFKAFTKKLRPVGRHHLCWLNDVALVDK
jgi:hypothetical protein